MKYLLFILISISLFSCKKEDVKPVNHIDNSEYTLTVLMLSNYGYTIKSGNSGSQLNCVKNVAIKITEMSYGTEIITFPSINDTDYKTVQFTWQGVNKQLKFRSYTKVLLTLQKGSLTIQTI